MKQTPDPTGKTVVFSVKEGYRILRCDDIVRCQAAGNYTTIFLANRQEISLCKRIGKVEAMLPQDWFCRVHQSHIVNLKRVEMWVKNGGGFLRIEGGVEVPVARSKRNHLRERLEL